MKSRKGARSRSEIPADVLSALNSGVEEAANLVEWLAVDKPTLLRAVAAGNFGYAAALNGAALAWEQAESGIVGCYKSVGLYLSSQEGFLPGESGWQLLAMHGSDSLRGLACFVAYYSIHERFQHTKPLSDTDEISEYMRYCSDLIVDSHFGVRELVWLAMRPAFIEAGPAAFDFFAALAMSENAYMRRFVSEVSRPVGVWAAHVGWLKTNPEFGEGLLKLLREDTSRYVQDSVGNWLNDAAKFRPEWVRELTETWLSETDSAATRYIVKRGLRSLK